MRTIVRLACLVYWVLLTIALLIPDPAAAMGLRRFPLFPWGDAGIHFAAMAILGGLFQAARRPKQSWWPGLAWLFIYGLLVESAQYFVPPRTVQWSDFAENTLGILAGAGAYAWLRTVRASDLATPAKRS